MTWQLTVPFNGAEDKAEEISSLCWDNNSTGLFVSDNEIVAGFDSAGDAQSVQSEFGGTLEQYAGFSQPNAGDTEIMFKDRVLSLSLLTSQSFGHGQHPTTAGCLDVLSHLPTPHRFLDVGTGSGILALCMAKVGAEVVLVENDADSLKQAKTNFESNDVAEPESHEDIASVDSKFDLIVANMLLANQRQVASQVQNLLSEHGTLVISGILDSQLEELCELYSALSVQATENYDEWPVVTFSHSA